MGIYRELHIWVEGDRDELFFREVIEPVFRKEYDLIAIHQWAQERKSKAGGKKYAHKVG